MSLSESMVALELPWPPSVNAYWVHRQRGTFISTRGMQYRKTTMVAIKQAQIFKPLEGRMHVVMRLYPPDNRTHDIDNLFKCLFDSLQHGGLVINDNQIKKLEAEMFDEPDDPRLGVVELYMAPLIHVNHSQSATIDYNESR